MPLLKQRYPRFSAAGPRLLQASGMHRQGRSQHPAPASGSHHTVMPSPLPFITEHNGPRAGARRRRRQYPIRAREGCVGCIPLEETTSCGLATVFRFGHVSVQMSPVPRAHPCEAGTHRMKRSPRHQPATGLLRESCVEEHGQTTVAQLTRPPTGTDIRF